MSANLSKETAAHATRWLRYQLGDETAKPMDWAMFSDGIEKQRDCARSTSEQYIAQCNELQGQVNSYRQTVKSLEYQVAESLGYRETIKALEAKLVQVEEQLARKDGYPAQPLDDGGPAFARPESQGLDGWWHGHQQGMSLRDWLAGMALQGYLAGRNNNRCENPSNFQAEEVGRQCYKYADGTIAASNGKGGLPKCDQVANELADSIESYFEIYANKDKKPGWCGRLDEARKRINLAIELARNEKGGA